MKTFLFFFFLLLSCLTFAQKREVRGVLVDTSDKKGVPNAVVNILSAADSFLCKHARTAMDGSFELDGLDTGKYILVVSVYGYGDLSRRFAISGDSGNAVNLGDLAMVSKAVELQAVVVKRNLPLLRMSGDTTDFITDSLKLRPYALVEDLLRYLPGMQIDKNGAITAQGKNVQRVLVDGNEFFGEDPTLATRNLYADMVEKVRLYDAQSKQAAFSGVDDNDKKTTLDLKLKKNSKRARFGKIEAGEGPSGLYYGQAMVNDFRDKRKIAGYVLAGSNGVIGLGDLDKNSFSGDENTALNDDLDSWNGNYNGQGLPVIQSGGLHFNDQWNEGQSVNGNYKIANLDISGTGNTLLLNYLPGGVLYNNLDQVFNEHSLRNKLSGKFEGSLNPSSTLEVSMDGTFIHKDVSNGYKGYTRRQDSLLLNTIARDLTVNGDNHQLNGSVLWLKKFPKTGRSFSVEMKESYNEKRYKGLLVSNEQFYNVAGVSDSILNINQAKVYEDQSFVFDSRLVYTEPLSENLTLMANYAIRVDNSNADRESFNQSPSGDYRQLDSLNSNRYQVAQLANRAGVAFNYKGNKVICNIGTDVSSDELNQTNDYEKLGYKKHFMNWYPAAKFKYNFSSQHILLFTYNGVANPPSLTQLNPVPVNDDPLNVYSGNPALTPSFRNDFNLLYRNFTMRSNTTFLVNAHYSFTADPITVNIETDSNGKNNYQYQNASKGCNADYSVYLLFSKRISGINVGLDGRLTGNTSINFNNGIGYVARNNTYNLGIGFSKVRQGVYDGSINISAAYNTKSSSIQKQATLNYFSSLITMSLDVFLPGKFQWHTDANNKFQQRSGNFNTDFNQFIWNTWIGRKFLSKDNLLIKCSVNDLLNQNKGFSRNVANNMMQQNSYTTISRYYMLSVVWSFINNTNKKTK